MLLRTVTQIKKYLKVNSTQTGDAFLPYTYNAQEKYIRPVLGRELLKALDDWDNLEGESKTENAALAALLPFVERAMARFTYFIAAPHLDLNVGETGFTVSQTQNMGVASSDRVVRYIESLEKMGYDDIESLLAFLEENKDDYPLWTASSAYTMHIRNFINSAEEFTIYISELDNSRLRFGKLRSIMDDVELLLVRKSISNELADEIMTQLKDGILSDANKLILPLIKRAVANFAWAKQADEITRDNYLGEREKELLERKKQFEATGTSYLVQVKRLLDANPDNHPAYKASAEYDATKPGFGGIENTPESPVVCFGL